MSRYLPRRLSIVYALLLVLGLVAAQRLQAQRTDLVINGGILTVRDTIVGIKVNGSVIVNNGEVLNSGNLVVTDSLVNHTPELFSKTSNPFLAGGDGGENKGTASGTVVFEGSKAQYVMSAQPKTIFFHSIDIQNPKGLTLLDSVYALGTINPVLGSLFLNGKNVYLFYDHVMYYKYDGRLGLETDKARIWDTTRIAYPPLNYRSGHVVAKFPNIESFALCNLGFKVKDNSINTPFVVERGHLSLPYAGDGSIRKYFTINTDDSKNKIEISYIDPSDYEQLGIQEPDLRIFLNQQNSPINYTLVQGDVDETKDQVSGSVSFTSGQQQIVTVADYNCANPPKAVLKAKADVCLSEPFEVAVASLVGAASQSVRYQWFKNDVLLADTLRALHDQLDSIGGVTYKLRVTDNRGCFSTDSLAVFCHPFPEAGFNLDDKNVGYCLGAVSTLTDTSLVSEPAKLTRLWSLNDGNTDTSRVVSHAYASAANYVVTLISTSQYGCSDTIMKNLKVHPLPEVYFTAHDSCGGSDFCADFTNGTTFPMLNYAVKSATWVFGVNDTLKVTTNYQASVSHCFEVGGVKNVQLLVESNAGCRDSFTDTIRVVQQTVDFSASDVCLGDKTVFVNSSVSQGATASYRWDFGDGTTAMVANPQKTYAAAGVYEVTLYMQSANCSDSLTREVRVLERPDAAFATTNACVGSVIEFTPGHLDQKTYRWEIAGDETSELTPVKTFDNAGTYNVSLTVTSGGGCAATRKGTFVVYPTPKADFAFQDACVGSAVSFRNRSSVTGGSLSYQWRFEGDDLTTIAHPSYTFQGTFGGKAVELIATSNYGCHDTIVKTVQIFPLPSAGLPDAISYCADNYVLDATVSDPAVTASYLWNTGGKQACLTVVKDGTYTVDIISDHGCRVQESTVVTLNAPIDPGLPDAMTFCGKGTLDALYADAHCTWYRDGVLSGQGRFLNVTGQGVYQVEVNDGRCTGSDKVAVTVHPLPVVALGDDVTACDGMVVSLDAGDGLSAYQWSTGQTSQTINVVTPAKYKVAVTNEYGCSNADTIVVSYLPVPPKPLPDAITQCHGAVIDAGGNAATYLWSTGATGRSIQVDASGSYWVKLSNHHQCYSVDTVAVTIHHADAVILGDDIRVCQGTEVVLNAGDHDAGYTYFWNGQASASNRMKAAKGGRYIVELLNADNGCRSRDTVFVEFKSAPQVNLGHDKALCNALSVTLDAGNPGSLYQWGSSNAIEGIQQQLEVTEPGKYWVIVMNPQGCIATDTIEVYPSSASLLADYIVASRVFAGDTINFYDLSFPEPYTSKWDFGDGIQSTLSNPSHVFYVPDSYQIVLTVDNSYCTSSITKTISVASPLKGKSIYSGEESINFVEILSSVLYPNPTNGAFTFEMTLSDNADVTIAIYDLMGVMHLLEKVDNLSKFNKHYNLHRLKPGIYIFKALVGKRAVTYKIVKH